MIAFAYWWLLQARWEMRALRGREWLVGEPEQRNAENPHEMDVDLEDIRRRARSVNLAARYPVRWAHCLQSSLALRKWLARRGVSAELHIGVRKHDGAMRAHAWIEYKGKVLNDIAKKVMLYAPLTKGKGRMLEGISSSGWE